MDKLHADQILLGIWHIFMRFYVHANVSKFIFVIQGRIQFVLQMTLGVKIVNVGIEGTRNISSIRRYVNICLNSTWLRYESYLLKYTPIIGKVTLTKVNKCKIDNILDTI